MAAWRSAIYYAYYDNTWELADKPPEELAERFAHFTPHRIGPHRGIRTQRFKLIEYYSEGDYWELFDLEKDPEELNNLYGDPAMAGMQASLKTELARIRKLYKDFDSKDNA
jgi:arylsulfatase A-like enzyme